MRIAVESAEVATLKEDGRPWDGPGGPRVDKQELASFFALDLTTQLDRLVESGGPPTPPDVFVRVLDGKRLLLETDEDKSFDPRWQSSRSGGEVEVAPGASLRVQVWDRDVMFNDLIGETTLIVPAAAPAGSGGKLRIGPFSQVRSLVVVLKT